MAKYYLTINGRPNVMNEVTWVGRQYQGSKPHDLESIDEFCMDFNDEDAIKAHLSLVALDAYQAGLIDRLPELKNQLNIRYQSRGAIKSLSYGLPYKKDRKYFDYEYLRACLQSLRNDAVLLARLAGSFSGAPIQAANLALFHRASIALKNGLPFHEEDRLYQAMTDFIQVEILKYDKELRDYKTDKSGALIIQWRKLHDLAMFVKNYEEKKVEAPSVPEIPVLVSEQPKKKILEPGTQLTLFDL
jgi:hypothetical protein